MAISQFVVTAGVTVWPGAPVSDGAGSSTIPDGTWSQPWPVTFTPGQVVVADPEPGNGAASLLYAAIGEANLRPYVPGSGSSGVSN